MNLPESTVITHQTKVVESEIVESEGVEPGRPGRYTSLALRYDDRLGSGYNCFTMKLMTYDLGKDGKRANFTFTSCDVEKMKRHFPDYLPYLKWQLVGSQGPMCYLSNTWYWAEQGELERARKSARWPEATLTQLADPEALKARLPGFMAEFKAAMESLGFTY